MILTDREIQVALATGQIKIKPSPKEAAYSSTSLDLTLGARVRIWKIGLKGGRVFCPAEPGFRVLSAIEEMAEPRKIGPKGRILEPGEFLLAWTAESIDLPIRSRLAARVEGKSSLARLGISIHVTAPTIHAGFRGAIQLEVCNHGTLRVKLVPKMPRREVGCLGACRLAVRKAGWGAHGRGRPVSTEHLRTLQVLCAKLLYFLSMGR